MSQGSNLRNVAHSVIIFSLFLVSTNAKATGGRPYIANYYVNTTIDDPFLTGEDGGLLSIRGAITRVITDWLPYDPIRTVIHIPAGHYTLTYTGGSPENEVQPISLGFHQFRHLEIRGAGRELTFLDGGSQTFLVRIQANSNQAVSTTNLTIQNGRHRQSGGMETRGNVFVEHCTFRNCVVGEGANTLFSTGGGIFHSSGLLTVRDSVFENCAAGRFGGAIYSLTAPINVERCVFRDNSVSIADGGAIFSRGPLTIIDSVFFNNSAARQGGAVVAYGPTTINHCTIVDNRSNADGANDGNGGGVRTVNGVLTLSNNIVAHNRNGAPGADAPDDLSGRLISAGYNIITTVTEQTIIDGDIANDLIEVDPLLGPLDFEEDLPFFPLRPGSPAIDAALTNSCSTYDLRGRARPFDGDNDGIARCDIGAVEFRMTVGDMNCDNAITVSDIGGFVLALTQPQVYAATFPGCERFNADANGDGALTVSDISDFIALLQ